MRWVLLGVLVLAGCGGPMDPCAVESTCSADPKLTAADIKACHDQQNAAPTRCTALYTAFTDCFSLKRICGSDKKTSAFGTYNVCKTESDAYTACVTK